MEGCARRRVSAVEVRTEPALGGILGPVARALQFEHPGHHDGRPRLHDFHARNVQDVFLSLETARQIRRQADSVSRHAAAAPAVHPALCRHLGGSTARLLSGAQRPALRPDPHPVSAESPAFTIDVTSSRRRYRTAAIVAACAMLAASALTVILW